jgi:hypothetical protein
MNTRQAADVVSYVRQLARGKKQVEDLSFRQMSMLCQVASPTICRFFQGRTIDAVTFLKFCDWLQPYPPKGRP